ncbi:hypothetical protein JCM14036_31480 [Desulfotomaculum defluvii]
MKNWKTKAVSTILAFAVLVPSVAFAADAVNGNVAVTGRGGFVQDQPFNQEKQQEFNEKLLALVSKYTPESLEEWQNAIAKQEQLRKAMKENKPVEKQKPEVSEEVKEKLKDIHDQIQSGKLTREQAQEQINSLGIENFGDRKEFNGQPKLSDEAKEKLKAIQEDVKSSKLTKEQAIEEMQKLGLNPRVDDQKNNSMAQFNIALSANDGAKIKELLPQMLEQLKEKNLQLSNKITESK